MNSSLVVDAVLSVFVLSYVFSGLTFVAKQKQGASFITSFDQAIARGSWFFALGSGLSFVTLMYGNLPQLFI